jgi:hypothetical protein
MPKKAFASYGYGEDVGYKEKSLQVLNSCNINV